MPHRSGTDIDDHNARDDEAQADVRGQIEMLLEVKNAHRGNEYDAEGAPYGVADAHGHALQHMGKGIERHNIPENGTQRGNRSGELLGGVQA